MHENGASISRGQGVARWTVDKIAKPLPFMRMEIANGENLDKPAELLQDGIGVAFAFTHPSRKETLQAFQMFFKDERFRGIRMYVPIALHEKMFFMDPLGKLCGVDTSYVATRRTRELYELKGKVIDPRYGEADVKKNMARTFSCGGVAPIFIQGTRSSTLYSPDNPRTVGTLMGSMRKIDFGITLVGVGIEGVNDYSKARGVNPWKKYKYVIGETFLSSDLAKLGLGNVDQFLYQQLENLVPQNYIGERPIRG